MVLIVDQIKVVTKDFSKRLSHNFTINGPINVWVIHEIDIFRLLQMENNSTYSIAIKWNLFAGRGFVELSAKNETYNTLTRITDIWAWRIPWWVRLNSAIFSNTFHYRIVTHFSVFRQTNGHIPWIILWCGFHFEFIAFAAHSYGRYRLTRFWINTSIGESEACFYLTASIINWITKLFLWNGSEENKRLIFSCCIWRERERAFIACHKSLTISLFWYGLKVGTGGLYSGRRVVMPYDGWIGIFRETTLTTGDSMPTQNLAYSWATVALQHKINETKNEQTIRMETRNTTCANLLEHNVTNEIRRCLPL